MTEKQFERAIARLDDGHDDPTPMRAGHVIVSRHLAAIEFIRQHAPEFRFARIITGNATAADVRGKIVAGNLPLHLAALCRTVVAVEFDGAPPRGTEYGVPEMVAAGARLTAYRVATVPDPPTFEREGMVCRDWNAALPAEYTGKNGAPTAAATNEQAKVLLKLAEIWDELEMFPLGSPSAEYQEEKREEAAAMFAGVRALEEIEKLLPELIAEKHKDGRWWLVWDADWRDWIKARWRQDYWNGFHGYFPFSTPTHVLPIPPAPEAR